MIKDDFLNDRLERKQVGKSLLFDLDGVLVDSTPAAARDVSQRS